MSQALKAGFIRQTSSALLRSTRSRWPWGCGDRSAKWGGYKGKSLVFLSHLIREELGERLVGCDQFIGRPAGGGGCQLPPHGASCEIELITSDTALLNSDILTPPLMSGVRLL
jgi:hypothetical protein